MTAMEDVQYSLASDHSKAASRRFVDPKTGGYYVQHVPEEDMGGRSTPRGSVTRGTVGDDSYHDPYKERGNRGWRYEQRELNDVRRVAKAKIVDNARLRVAGYASSPIPGVETPTVHVSGYRPFSREEARAGGVPEDPFAYVEPEELRRLIRAHNYVYTVTICLSPKIMAAKYGDPDPPRTLEEYAEDMRRNGAILEKTEPYENGKMLLFRFMEIHAEGSDRLRLEDEIRDLTEANLTSFVEDWVAVRIVVRLQKKKDYSLVGYFFTVG